LADGETGIVEDALRKHVKALTLDIGPRTPFTGDSLARAAGYIQSVLEDAGLCVTEQAYQYYGQHVVNVIATPPATTRASAYYVVGAHYDTVATTPGADDNASAVAVMLELARRLPQTKLKAPVVFAAFTLEEPPAFMTGHQGSRVFVRACKSKGDRVLGALILEMVGYTSPRQHYPFVVRWTGYPAQGNFIGIVGNWRSRQFGRAVLFGFRNNKDLPVESLFLPFDGWILPETRLSDHASFWDAGWPALMVTDTAFFRNPNYHLATDSIDTLDFIFMAQLVKSLELALAELPALPLSPSTRALANLRRLLPIANET
jgi:Zn-dependent M28 family amino/carboxypeptidase